MMKNIHAHNIYSFLFIVCGLVYGSPREYHIAEFTASTPGDIAQLYTTNPGPLILFVECLPKNSYSHSHHWWNHFTRHCTWNNGFQILKTIGSITFLACFCIALVIQKTYTTTQKVHSLFTTRSMMYDEEHYSALKRYELLFITYKKIDSVLRLHKVRHYFADNEDANNIVDDTLAYITMYETRYCETE